MTQYYISKVHDTAYGEVLGERVVRQSPCFVYVKVPLFGMVSIEVPVPNEAVEIEAIDG